MYSLSIIWKQTICMKYINQHIANCTALRRSCYVFIMTSYRQSTRMEGQYWFSSTSARHLTRLTTTTYTIHWNRHLAPKEMIWNGSNLIWLAALKQFTLRNAHLSPMSWSKACRRDPFWVPYYSPSTSHLWENSGGTVWLSIYTQTIRSFI